MRGAGAATSPSPPGRRNRAFYGFLWLSLNAAFRLYFRLRVEGAPRLRGPFVLVANHTSFLDPVLLCCAQRRRIAFMMSDIYYRSPRWGWFYRMMGAIPVSQRGANLQAIRAARAALRRGDVVGVFPEGGLSRDGLPYLGHPGAVSLVLSAGVPVVAAGIRGAGAAMGAAGGVPRPARISIRFGAPIAPEELGGGALGGGALGGGAHASRKERLSLATARIMAEIAGLCGQVPREAEIAASASRAMAAEPGA